jgi:hypothetical protein
MGLTFHTTCLDCGNTAPEVGDCGYIGYPSGSPERADAEVPNLGYIYRGFEAIHLVTHQLDSLRGPDASIGRSRCPATTSMRSAFLREHMAHGPRASHGGAALWKTVAASGKGYEGTPGARAGEDRPAGDVPPPGAKPPRMTST